MAEWLCMAVWLACSPIQRHVALNALIFIELIDFNLYTQQRQRQSRCKSIRRGGGVGRERQRAGGQRWARRAGQSAVWLRGRWKWWAHIQARCVEALHMIISNGHRSPLVRPFYSFRWCFREARRWRRTRLVQGTHEWARRTVSGQLCGDRVSGRRGRIGEVVKQLYTRRYVYAA